MDVIRDITVISVISVSHFLDKSCKNMIYLRDRERWTKEIFYFDFLESSLTLKRKTQPKTSVLLQVAATEAGVVL